MNRICRWALALGLGVASQTTFAQQLSISGTVQDGTGIIPDAQVTLRDPVGATTKSTTDAVGKYHFDGLRSGAYEIAVSRQGFAPSTRALTLTGESRTVDLTLQVTGGATSIDVNDTAGRSTAAGMEVANSEIPSYVVSVSESTLREQAINDLPSALQNISGVMAMVQYGVYEVYTISGVGQQADDNFMYVDGMTLTGNRSNTQLNDIEEVQVFKGPNSVLYGGSVSGQGGMINVIRKKPSSIRANEIQYRLGAWNTHQVAGASAGQVFHMERLLYRVDAAFADGDGWRHAGSKQFTVGPKLTWLIAPRMSLSTTQTLTRDRYKLDGGVPIALINRPGFPFDRRLNDPGDFQLSRDWQNKVDYVWNITNRLTIKNTFFKRVNRDQYFNAESLAYVPATDLITRGLLYFQHNRRPLQDITDVTGDYDIFGMRHRFMLRYDYSDQYRFTDRTGPTAGSNTQSNMPLPSIPVQDFIAGAFVDTAPIYTNFPVQRRDFTDSIYHRFVFQDQFEPLKWLGVNVVLSRPIFDRKSHNDNYDNGTFVSSGVLTHLQNQSRVNYRLGAAIISQRAPWLHGFAPYFSYNTSFNPATQIPADGSQLDPVINKSWEVGYRWQGLRNRLTIMNAYRRIQDQNRVVTISTGVFEQVGKATTYNTDLDINGNVGRGFSVLANYSYADSLIDRFRTDGLPQVNGGKRFAYNPKHISRVWITKSLNVGEESKLNFSLGGRYVRHYFTSTANTTMVPSLTTFDGAATFTRRKYDLQVNFANLLNKERYFPSVINSTQLYPGPRINATMTLRYRF